MICIFPQIKQDWPLHNGPVRKENFSSWSDEISFQVSCEKPVLKPAAEVLFQYYLEEWKF